MAFQIGDNRGSYLINAPSLRTMGSQASNNVWGNSLGYNDWRNGSTYNSDLASAQQFLASNSPSAQFMRKYSESPFYGNFDVTQRAMMGPRDMQGNARLDAPEDWDEWINKFMGQNRVQRWMQRDPTGYTNKLRNSMMHTAGQSFRNTSGLTSALNTRFGASPTMPQTPTPSIPTTPTTPTQTIPNYQEPVQTPTQPAPVQQQPQANPNAWMSQYTPGFLQDYFSNHGSYAGLNQTLNQL